MKLKTLLFYAEPAMGGYIENEDSKKTDGGRLKYKK